MAKKPQSFKLDEKRKVIILYSNVRIEAENDLINFYLDKSYLYNVIENEYYGEYDEVQLLEGAYKGMFQSLDRYSTYMNPEEYEE